MEQLKSLSPLAAAEKYGWPASRPKICELTVNFECNARCVFCYSPNSEPAWHNGRMKAVANLNRARVKVSFNFAVTSANYRQMPLFAKLAGVTLGVTGFCFMFSFYSGGMLDSENGLNVSYSEAVPYLRLALRYMIMKNIPIESKMLSNFTPCVAPELANLMSDCRDDAPESGSKISSGKVTRVSGGGYRERKVKPESCSECVYFRHCYGADEGYLKIYGSGEFVPVKKTRLTYPYRTLYP